MGNLNGVDPQLGPLQDNGGPTLTHADVMITTLIWYMQDRMDEVLSPNAHASLITLAEHCETLPAFHAAALSDFEMMPRS